MYFILGLVELSGLVVIYMEIQFELQWRSGKNSLYVIPGLILPNGEINWNCPCLGGMASGPCGTEFKEAFSCFHYSKEEVKGSECLEQFRAMQECMQRYPELYPQEAEQTAQDSAPAETSAPNPTSEPDSDAIPPLAPTEGTPPLTESSVES